MTTMNTSEAPRVGIGLKAFVLAVVALMTVNASAQVGYLHGLSGSATFKKGTARAVAAKVGDTFEAGTVVATGDDARAAVLKFADGQVAVLGPGSALDVRQYRFDARNLSASSMTIVLEAGTMRLTGGVIAAQEPQAVRLIAGGWVLGIARGEGIDLTLGMNDTGRELRVAEVTAGEISVRTPNGQIARIGPGQITLWRPGSQAGSAIPLAAAPAAIQAGIAILRSVLLPDTTPVPVEIAARAAIALDLAERARAAAAATPGNAELQSEAQSAATLAGAAVRAMITAAQDLMATILEARLAALPATAAGPQSAALPGPTLADLPPVASFVAAPIPPVVTTPGGGGRCVGSPC